MEMKCWWWLWDVEFDMMVSIWTTAQAHVDKTFPSLPAWDCVFVTVCLILINYLLVLNPKHFPLHASTTSYRNRILNALLPIIDSIVFFTDTEYAWTRLPKLQTIWWWKPCTLKFGSPLCTQSKIIIKVRWRLINIPSHDKFIIQIQLRNY